MRNAYGFVLITFLLTSPASAQMNDTTQAEIRAMNWLPASGQKLPKSSSQMTSLPGYVGVVGAQALRIQEIAGNSLLGVEADFAEPKSGAEAIFSYTDDGYVKSDDWNDVNPQKFIEEIGRNTEAANPDRRSRGVSPIHVDGWVQTPTLNSDTHTISWIILAHADNGDRSLNAIALKLGRRGTERITLIDEAKNSGTAAQTLLLISNAHRFNAGERYDEYKPESDKAAEYGVAGLVAGVMGVKLLKVAAAGGLLLVLKKAGFVILLPLFWVWKKLSGKKGTSTI